MNLRMNTKMNVWMNNGMSIFMDEYLRMNIWMTIQMTILPGLSNKPSSVKSSPDSSESIFSIFFKIYKQTWLKYFDTKIACVLKTPKRRETTSQKRPQKNGAELKCIFILPKLHPIKRGGGGCQVISPAQLPQSQLPRDNFSNSQFPKSRILAMLWPTLIFCKAGRFW